MSRREWFWGIVGAALLAYAIHWLVTHSGVGSVITY